MVEQITLSNLPNVIELGQFVSVELNRPTEYMDTKQRKNSMYRGVLAKSERYSSVRFCDYENLKKVKELRERGIKPTPTTDLWWEWEVFPIIARHKKDHTKRYIVVKPTDNYVYNSQYIVSGREVEKEVIKPHLLKSSSKPSTVIMLPLEHIKTLHINKVNYALVLK